MLCYDLPKVKFSLKDSIVTVYIRQPKEMKSRLGFALLLGSDTKEDRENKYCTSFPGAMGSLLKLPEAYPNLCEAYLLYFHCTG